MTPHPALRTKLASALARVRSYAAGDPLDPALEALALCAVAAVGGALDEVAAKERRAAVAAGARALLAARGDRDADGSLHVAVALAADGLDALRGTPSTPGTGGRPREGSPLHPSPTALVAMRRGDPDPFAAAIVAAHVRRCTPCRDALTVATADDAATAGGRRTEGAPPLRVAASSATVRSPTEGRRVGRRAEPAVEAVLFADEGVRRLAVYGDARLSLRLAADGVSTEDQLPGYWLGRVAEGVVRLDAVLHVGDAQVAWKLSLR